MFPPAKSPTLTRTLFFDTPTLADNILNPMCTKNRIIKNPDPKTPVPALL